MEELIFKKGEVVLAYNKDNEFGFIDEFRSIGFFQHKTPKGKFRICETVFKGKSHGVETYDFDYIEKFDIELYNQSLKSE